MANLLFLVFTFAAQAQYLTKVDSRQLGQADLGPYRNDFFRPRLAVRAKALFKE